MTHKLYRGDSKIVFDIDECTNGSYSCTCDHGFHGDGRTCSDINVRYSGNDNCDANASCSNTFDSYECACNDGFEGDGES